MASAGQRITAIAWADEEDSRRAARLTADLWAMPPVEGESSPPVALSRPWKGGRSTTDATQGSDSLAATVAPGRASPQNPRYKGTRASPPAHVGMLRSGAMNDCGRR